MTGARLVIAKPDGHKDPHYLAEIIEKQHITTIHFVPSMFRMFLSEESEVKRCGSLRRIICSGESLDKDSVNKCHSLLKSKIYNLYGPTEAAVDVSYYECLPDDTMKTVPIGKAITNIRLYVLDSTMKKVFHGMQGELYIGGIGVARGYCNRPELTKERFLSDPFGEGPGNLLYKTGDICSMKADGTIHYFGRIDDQVKIRGMRIELGEIEAAIRQFPGIKDVAVVVKSNPNIQDLLVAYFSSTFFFKSTEELRRFLQGRLPEHMIPQRFIQRETLPYTASGKIDKKELPDPDQKRPPLGYDYCAPDSETEKRIELIWRELLGFSAVGVNDNLFDLGGNSFIVLKICAALKVAFSKDVPIVKVFQYPTIRALAAYLDDENKSALSQKVAKRISAIKKNNEKNDNRVAIVGLAGRYPGADTIDEFWLNLCNGVETITFFSDEDLDNEIEKELRENPKYIKARGIINDADKFDAAFFGISPHEAEVMDPQHRVFLELAWSALENAGHTPDSYKGNIGVYAGVGDNYYYANHVLPNTRLVKMVGKFTASYGNEKDYISTRVSYELNCKGPGVSVNTGCSTSLLAVDLAYRALLDNECDMALAGGVDIHVPQRSGQLYQEGGVFSIDGHCRPFDADATGTMFCDGAGIVVLKRYEDAIADNNTIYAVISGCAKNNDGSDKVSFLAPSVDGQAEVIAMAQANAGVSAGEISYIEAHGTGTPMGDPIEVEALTRAFRLSTEKKQFCGLGSVKGHVGHPTIASGVTGLIKATLCLFHEKIPQTLHYKNPNPHIDFQNTPFYVVDKLQQWPRTAKKRIAGVSSFGFGGTNVHVIIEEAPVIKTSQSPRETQLLIASAKSEKSLDKTIGKLETYVAGQKSDNLSDLSFTLACGRSHMKHRSFAVVSKDNNQNRLFGLGKIVSGEKHTVAFMFPGQGAQYPGMGKQLYDREFIYKTSVDLCAEILRPFFERDIREVIFPEETDLETSAMALQDTRWTQPALFITGYSLARLMMTWGIQPAAMIGHSIGELVCACLSGVLSVEDALKLVAHRGSLMKSMQPGTMLSVRLPVAECEKYTSDIVSIAAINSPSLCVLAGPNEKIDVIEKELTTSFPGVCKKLHTSHAFHSPMMDPVIPQFLEIVKKVTLHKPLIPFVSSVTGTWITDDMAIDPAYWASHVRKTVRFADGISCLLQDPQIVFLETGPRATSATLARQQIKNANNQIALSVLSATANPLNDYESVLSAIGHLWQLGLNVDWNAYFATEKRLRIAAPSYSFEKKRYWVEAATRTENTEVTTEMNNNVNASIDIEMEKPIVKVQNDIGSTLRSILTDVSGYNLENYSDETTFFEMGMDSLFLSQVAFKLEELFGVSLSFGQLTEKYPTISALINFIESQGNNNLKSIQPDITSITEPQLLKTYPLTDAQKEILMSIQLGGKEASCAFNESVIINLSGGLNLTALENAIKAVECKHDSLRSRINTGDYTFTIDGTSSLSMQRIGLSGYDREAQDRAINDILDQCARTPFDFKKDQLISIKLLEKSPTEHLLLITVHHIICDGWSIDVLLEDISSFYSDYALDKPVSIKPVCQFSDYALMQQEEIRKEEFSRVRRYWMEKFSDLPKALSLPTDKVRPAIRSFTASRADYTISKELVAGLKEAAQKNGISFFGALLSAFETFCYRLTNQKEIVIGVPLAGQMIAKKPELIGHCVHYMPIRCHMDTTMPFAECAEHIKKTLSDASNQQPYTYGMLLDDLPFPREAGQMPLVTVSFNAISMLSDSQFNFAGINATYENVPRHYENFELFVNAVSNLRNNELILKCQYSTALFTEDMVIRRCAEFETFLKGVIKSWHKPIGLLPVLCDRDHNRLIGPTLKTDQHVKSIYSLFYDQVIRNPDKTAIISEDEQISYTSLLKKVNNVASAMYQKGIRKGDRIGISMPRCPDMVVALMAALASSVTYIPIDPKFPVARRKYMIKDSEISVVITVSELDSLFSGLGVELLSVDNLDCSTGDSLPDVSFHMQDIAYIMYTSGSTGQPKGVEIKHGSIVNFLLSMKQKPGMTEKDIICAVTTLSFDISVLELLLPLICGASCRIVSDDKASDGFALKKILDNGGITVFQATPSTYRLLLEAGWKGSGTIRLLCGGEAMTEELATKLIARCTELWNMYGPTEATVWCTIRKITEPHEFSLIGHPIHNTSVCILDEINQPVPPGVIGEIHIGGVQLANGYFRQVEKTASQFIEDPQIPGEIIYKTGDLGYLTSYGELRCLGRKDFQVKIRGHRIELGEIESVLNSYPGIKESVVTIYSELEQSEKQLAAYFIPDAPLSTLNTQDIKTFLISKLPAYMVPLYLKKVEIIPKTANGKIDRKNLPKPFDELIQQESSSIVKIVTADEVESLLVKIWETLLGRTGIGIHQSFFDLGGTSILAVRLMAQLSELKKIEIPVLELFKNPTISLFAQFLRNDTKPADTLDSRMRGELRRKRIIRKNETL
ncbi:MAG TPA: amino acid adenylation domain-containing protein [Chitinispirillaceae bacterium]|nr:amino acid adenylation domain-containing protein [Chitinispirillaceae bacterium]